MRKTIRSLMILSMILVFLFAAGVVAKNVFLRQIRVKIQDSIGYSRLHLSFLPPALILEDIRSKSVSPFFSARRMEVKISYRSLLTAERPLDILVETPILRVYSQPGGTAREGDKSPWGLDLPFPVERGLIRGGALYYWGKEMRLQIKEVNASFIRKGSSFTVRGEARECFFSPGKGQDSLEGQGSFMLEGKGKEIEVKQIRFSSPKGTVRASGELVDPFDPEMHLLAAFHVRAGVPLSILRLPFEADGWTEGKAEVKREGGRITVRAEFSSPDLRVNGVPSGRVTGNLEASGTTGSLDFSMRKVGLPPEFVRLRFGGGRISGEVRAFHLDPIIPLVKIPWPVSSPCWGRFSGDGRSFRGEIEFRDGLLEPEGGRFPFRGSLRIEAERLEKISFFSENLESSFARVSVDGELVLGKTVDVILSGEVKDVREARRFTSLVLEKVFPFPEIRGTGSADIRIFGDVRIPEVKARFSMRPAGFGFLDMESVEGEAEIAGRDFSGRFQVDGAAMRGKIDVHTRGEDVEVEADLEKGNVEDLLPGFGLDYPLQGEIRGRFRYTESGEAVRLEGDFSGDRLVFSGQPISQVQGKLAWTGGEFAFPRLEFLFHGGQVRGSSRFNLERREFDLEISGGEIDLSSLYPRMQGELYFQAKGKGILGKDAASGSFAVKNLLLPPFQETGASGEIQATFTEERMDLEIEGDFQPGENRFFVSLGLPFFSEALEGDIRGYFTELDLLIPWKGAKGRLNYMAELRGSKSAPQAKGALDFQGTVFPFPQFAHALRDYSGLVFFDNGEFSLRSLRGKLGGGDVQGSGRLQLGASGVEEIDVRAEGKGLLLSPMERTRALADGSLNLIKDGDRFLLRGDFLIHQLRWRREITEKFAFSSAALYEVPEEPRFFDDLTLDIRLKADDNAWMENSLGRIRGRFDLKITGNIHSPVILGDIEALDGELTFQDREFRILTGRVSFINPLSIEPYLSFKGETYVKDYRVTFSLDGLLSHLNPEFSSSPPLPPEDVLALLALGEAFKRTYSYDMSTQLSTASLLSFQLSEEAKKRAERLFSIDRFRIDPFILGSSAEMTARLTVGKKISRNFFILYSTNLTTQREEIIRIEWELSDDLSVVGTRDEKGRVSFDVKIHKRF